MYPNNLGIQGEMPQGEMIDARSRTTGEMPPDDVGTGQGSAMGAMPAGEMPRGEMDADQGGAMGAVPAGEMPRGEMDADQGGAMGAMPTGATTESRPTGGFLPLEITGEWRLTMSPASIKQ